MPGSRWGPWDGRCRTCGGAGPFGPQSRICNPCKSRRQQERYAANPEPYRARARAADRELRTTDIEAARAKVRKNVGAYRERHRERLAEEARQRRYDPAWRARYLGPNRAMGAVRRAIQDGLLKRPTTCTACGGLGPIEAAHQDYSRPLDVRWLCRPCHRQWDAAVPKTRK